MALWRICFPICYQVTWMMMYMVMVLIMLLMMDLKMVTLICRAKQVESMFDASESWSNLWTRTRVVPDKIPEVPPGKLFVDYPHGVSLMGNNMFVLFFTQPRGFMLRRVCMPTAEMCLA